MLRGVGILCGNRRDKEIQSVWLGRWVGLSAVPSNSPGFFVSETPTPAVRLVCVSASVPKKRMVRHFVERRDIRKNEAARKE